MDISYERTRMRVAGLGLTLAAGGLAVSASELDSPVVEPQQELVIDSLRANELANPEPTATATHESRGRASRGKRQPTGIDLGEFESTCYNLRGITASGKRVGWGRVAVDPDVIPLGTRLYIQGYGESIAADTGGVIDGRIIDVWKPTREQCMKWGRRTVRVTQLSK